MTHASLKPVVAAVILIITDTIIQPLLVAGALHGSSYLILQTILWGCLSPQFTNVVWWF